jgi:hypothetical protein
MRFGGAQTAGDGERSKREANGGRSAAKYANGTCPAKRAASTESRARQLFFKSPHCQLNYLLGLTW